MNKVTVTEEMVFGTYKKREKDCHKGDFGRLLNIAGSANYPGAAILSSKAAYAAGCGYLYLASLKEITKILVGVLPEAVLIPLEEIDGVIARENIDLLDRIIGKMDAISIGCGVSNSEEIYQILRYLLRQKKPLVIDADGLNVLAQHKELLQNKRASVILTPHIGEFSRLSGWDVATVKKYKEHCAKEFADEYEVCVILKDAESVIASYRSDEVYLIKNGSPGMAKAGSGDALTGIVGSLLAQGYSQLSSACMGAYLHAAAGSKASLIKGEASMRASDLIDALSVVFAEHQR